MRLRCITILLLLSHAALASDQVLFHEDDLAALFTSPNQRKQIDRQRGGDAVITPAEEKSRPSHIKVNGLMKSSKGSSVVWVNGKTTQGRGTQDGVKVLRRQSTTSSVVMMVDGKIVRVRPGESWSDQMKQE